MTLEPAPLPAADAPHPVVGAPSPSFLPRSAGTGPAPAGEAPPPSGPKEARTRPWALVVTPGAGQSVTVLHSHAVPGLGRWPAWLEVRGRASAALRIGLAVLGRRWVLDVPAGARAEETANAVGAALELLLEAGGVPGFRADVDGARVQLRPWRQS